MTIRHMRIFLAIAESGYSTTRAAEALNMTQPAVSLAVRELEEYYGVVLFDRIGRRLRITAAGERFLEYARGVDGIFEDMERAMRNWDALGLIRVGASVTIGSQFLPGYVRSFQNRHPGTEVRALVAPSEELERRITDSALDLALIEGPAHDPALISEEYMEDELVVIRAPAGEGPGPAAMDLREFRTQKFLLRERGSGTREVFDQAVEAAGFAVEPIWEATSTTALVNAVIEGLGVAVLPHRMLHGPLEQGLVEMVTVEGLTFRRKFNIVYHRQKRLTSAARDFLDLCRSYELDYPQPRYGGLF